MTLFAATTNQGKLRELLALAPAGVNLAPLPDLGDIPTAPETGFTFEENAIQKAHYYGARTRSLLIAEDSGLAVDALNGAPGIHSARYAGEGATDAANNRLLLHRMRETANRQARYVCAIALVRAGKLVRTFHGEVEGVILEHPRGSGGFGYDPLFFYPAFQATFAEVDLNRKQQVSHRARAAQALWAFVRAGL